MSYDCDPREVIRQVRDAAASEDPFPPPCAGRLVSSAIDTLKEGGAAPEDIAVAEGLSLLLYRLEVATWASDPDEPKKVRSAIAAWGVAGVCA